MNGDHDREVVLRFQGVDIAYGGHRVVKGATFDIRKGELFSLVGESGSGKTTIGRCILGLVPRTAGTIEFDGVALERKLRREQLRRIQMVFQDPASSLNERATVEQIVSEGLRNFRLYTDDADRRRKVERILGEVGLLPEHLSRYPHEFSGGQRQRIGIARAMVMEPELLIADEPISALDVSVRAQVLNLLKRLQKEHGTTVLFIAHDLSVVRHISDRIAVICKGDIVELAPAEELFRHPLHPYTQSLLSAIPIPDPVLERSKRLIGYDPSVHDHTKECPQLTDIGHGHLVFGSSAEVEAYRALREDGTPLPQGLFREPLKVSEPVQRPDRSRWRKTVGWIAAVPLAVAAGFGLCLLLAVV